MVGVRTHGAEEVPRGPKPGSYLSGRGLLIVPPGQVAARNAQQHDTIIAPPRGVEPRTCMSCPCPPSSGLMREATTGTATIRGMRGYLYARALTARLMQALGVHVRVIPGAGPQVDPAPETEKPRSRRAVREVTKPPRYGSLFYTVSPLSTFTRRTD